MFKATTFLATILVGVAGCAEVETDEDLELQSQEAELAVDDDTDISGEKTIIFDHGTALPPTDGVAAAATTPSCSLVGKPTRGRTTVNLDARIACNQYVSKVTYNLAIEKNNAGSFTTWGDWSQHFSRSLPYSTTDGHKVNADCGPLKPSRQWRGIASYTGYDWRGRVVIPKRPLTGQHADLKCI